MNRRLVTILFRHCKVNCFQSAFLIVDSFFMLKTTGFDRNFMKLHETSGFIVSEMVIGSADEQDNEHKIID